MDKTGIRPFALEQRKQLNLCGMHAIVRTFLYCTEQQSDAYQLKVEHVDVLRRYTLCALGSRDTRLHYPLTDKELASNNLCISTKNNRENPVEIEVDNEKVYNI